MTAGCAVFLPGHHENRLEINRREEYCRDDGAKYEGEEKHDKDERGSFQYERNTFLEYVHLR